MNLSIIIPYHNEGAEFISATLLSIYKTIDVKEYEVIVIDDGSTIPLEAPEGVRLIRHSDNRGVGAAFDTGVSEALSENLFLMGADIRFENNAWASGMISEIKRYPNSLTCTSCVNLSIYDTCFETRRNLTVANGATILIHPVGDSPKKLNRTLEAQWLPRLKDRDIPSHEIPCILGAAYGVSKQWYQWIDGFSLHKHWGTLEPYISLKSWMFGGSCRTAPRIETGHIFRQNAIHDTPPPSKLYNKMLVVALLFTDESTMIRYQSDTRTVQQAREMFDMEKPNILAKRQEYKDKTVMTPEQYMERWGISNHKMKAA